MSDPRALIAEARFVANDPLNEVTPLLTSRLLDLADALEAVLARAEKAERQADRINDLENTVAQLDGICEWISAALDGCTGAVSDFAESFPLVRKAMDVVAEKQAALATLEALEMAVRDSAHNPAIRPCNCAICIVLAALDAPEPPTGVGK